MHRITSLAALTIVLGCGDAGTGGAGADTPATGGAGAGGEATGGGGGTPASGGSGGSGGAGGESTGGSSTGGAPVCEPTSAPGLTPDPVEPGVAQVLAVEQGDIWGLALDADFLYWTNGADPGRLVRQPHGGGDLEVLVGDFVDPGPPVLDDTYVYVSDFDGTIQRVPKQGGCREAIVSGLDGNVALRLDGDDLFFTDAGTGVVGAAPKAGGAATTLASGQPVPRHLVATATHLYWVNYAGNVVSEGSVSRMPRAGGPVEVLATGLTVPRNLMVYDGQLLYTSAHPLDNGRDLIAQPLDGGAPETLVQFDAFGDHFEDGGVIYFAHILIGSRSIHTWSPTAGEALLLDVPARPYNLVGNATHLYWMSYDTEEIFGVELP